MAGRRAGVAAAAALGLLSLGLATVPPAHAAVAAPSSAGAVSYVVVAKDAASLAAARSAVTAAGGTVTGEDAALAIITARSTGADFATRTDASRAVFGVARNRPIGSLPRQSKRHSVMDDPRAAAAAVRQVAAPAKPVPKAEPLAKLQWDMTMIGATPTGSYARQQGSKAVRVGVIDTGIDGSHPDIKPNFSKSLSRNFVTDIPSIDGPCEHADCVDPVDEDDGGHGTHVAGTIGSPINGIGIAGVAPKVTLVNIRAGQDAGFFFLEPTIKALRYAGDAGVDVVNMSFFIDPWLFNCEANRADNPAEQAEQRAIIEATQRALRYAHRRGVTLVAALGNEHKDLGKPGTDTISPDYPTDAKITPRTIDNATCLTLPAEGRDVIGVSAVGPSGTKAEYSNYGLERNDVSAPGGFFRDRVHTSAYQTTGNLVLAPMPRNVAVSEKRVSLTTGAPTDPLVVASCHGTGPNHCDYWQYLQGTSMASPHAAGVAALIVAKYGHGSLDPDDVDRILRSTATHKACPSAVITYSAAGRPAEFNAPCVGTAERNSIYGDGIVNALRAVTG